MYKCFGIFCIFLFQFSVQTSRGICNWIYIKFLNSDPDPAGSGSAKRQNNYCTIYLISIVVGVLVTGGKGWQWGPTLHYGGAKKPGLRIRIRSYFVGSGSVLFTASGSNLALCELCNSVQWLGIILCLGGTFNGIFL